MVELNLHIMVELDLHIMGKLDLNIMGKLDLHMVSGEGLAQMKDKIRKLGDLVPRTSHH
jgi:hypothetical protein